MIHLTCQLQPYSVPLVRPLRTAGQNWLTREGWWVVLRDAAGCVGIGEVSPLPDWGSETPAQCREAVATLSTKRFGVPDWGGSNQAESWSQAAAAAFGILREAYPALWAGIELALLDYFSLREGVTLDRLLGGCGTRAPVTNALLDATDTAELMWQAQERRAQGFGCFKLKIGYAPVDSDVARIAAVREVLGADAQIRLDANGTWSRPEAIAHIKRLAPFDIAYVEQPVAARDLDGLRLVQDETGVPVAADEAVGFSADAVSHLIASGVACLVIKPGAHGGIIRALSISRACQAAGPSVVMTSALDRGVGSLGVAHALAVQAQPLPCGLGTFELLADSWPSPPLTCHGPAIALPERAGLGLAALPSDLVALLKGGAA